jgi:DNA invertase Pin-like site-specific DNA recombinase
MSDKIKAQHWSRKAVLYVRQSSTVQVIHNLESQRLQYAMEERLAHLGWRDVEVIDEDLGRSAAGTVVRAGFQRLVAEVCLGHVGAVAAREVSRFARNNREWQHLIEVCRMVDTLLIDHETVYDSRLGNDRLLLGLKGSLNEYELDLLRQRAVEARRAKARRGEFVANLPVGHLKGEDGRIEQAPDQRVQEAIRLVFRKFMELGAIRQVLLWFLEEGLKLPVRRWNGRCWETIWKRPRYTTVRSILTNPIHGGAYAYGKTEVVARYRDGLPVKEIRTKARADWLALIPHHHDGYVSWEEFERVQKMIEKNAQAYRATHPGAAKRGAALLAGVLRCRRCGRKMLVKYTGRERNMLRYACNRGFLDNAEARCIEFGGRDADAAIAGQLLRVLEPAALAAALQAHQQQVQHQDDVVTALTQELEAARYAADSARRQYDLIDPANRLVAAELERRWEAALQQVSAVELRLEQAQDKRPLPVPSQADFLALAKDFATVWNHPDVDVRLKKRLLRILVHEIVVDIDEAAAEVVLVTHWQGGVHSELRVRRRRHGQNRLHTPPDVVDAVRELVKICPDDIIAGILNRAGLRTGHGNRWTRERVVSLRGHFQIRKHNAERQAAEGWLNLTDAAATLGVCTITLRRAIDRGVIQASHPFPDGPWIIHRSQLETGQGQAVALRAQRHHRTPAQPKPNQQNVDFFGISPEEAV